MEQCALLVLHVAAYEYAHVYTYVCMYEYIHGWLRVEPHSPSQYGMSNFQEENKKGMIFELKFNTTIKLMTINFWEAGTVYFQ